MADKHPSVPTFPSGRKSKEKIKDLKVRRNTKKGQRRRHTTDSEKKNTRKILHLKPKSLLTPIIDRLSGCQSVHKSKLKPSL